ncbi:MAG: hypothetical protein HYS63_03810 [Methylocystis sp.]|nr:hypothetical protein [Methylocystis sp.]
MDNLLIEHDNLLIFAIIDYAWRIAVISNLAFPPAVRRQRRLSPAISNVRAGFAVAVSHDQKGMRQFPRVPMQITIHEVQSLSIAAARRIGSTNRSAIVPLTEQRNLEVLGGMSRHSRRNPPLVRRKGAPGRISDQRNQKILLSVIDAVALNPQPLPPRAHELLQAVVNAPNPQPLPPGPS